MAFLQLCAGWAEDQILLFQSWLHHLELLPLRTPRTRTTATRTLRQVATLMTRVRGHFSGGVAVLTFSQEDDTAALLAELEKIKASRAEESVRKESEAAVAEHAVRSAVVAAGNPLLQHLAGESGGGDAVLKRSWHEDSVFKHQARSEPALKKRFTNDTTRNDFHVRFLNKCAWRSWSFFRIFTIPESDMK